MPPLFSNSASGLFLPQTGTADAPLEQEILTLFDSMSAQLLRYAMSFGLTAHDGEDIIQEVFLALFHHLQKGRSRSNLRGWVFRVTHNLALKRRMGNRSRANVVQMEDFLPEQHTANDLTPEEEVLLGERQARLLAVYRVLPENERLCLQLRAEGLTYREIAQVVGVSLGTVSTLLTRSLARLARTEGR
ncbi:MAG TPA: sigma-70 family RNA polymerase sigma factor [Granulicella sp.]